MTKYSIYKDEKPQVTITKIKEILRRNKIEIEEEFTSNDKEKLKLCPSTRINIVNTRIGSNGKGTCVENSLASAYGEFMERLQNLELIPFKYPDTTLVNIKKIQKNLLCNTKIDIESKNIETIPFYSVKNSTVVDVPLYLFETTTGLAAGNTFEEAIVQGLSEICERYAIKEVLTNKYSLPNIPKELYENYKNIKEIINYYETNGYEVYIKDASIGLNLPVVCVVAIKRQENLLIFSMGSHPTLPVAVERALTELFQGRNLSENEKNKKDKRIYITKEYYDKYIKNNPITLYEQLILCSIFFKDNEDLLNQFILNKASFEFNYGAWIIPSPKTSNKELLKFIINNIEQITNRQIYIRNVSFLGFPTISIYIPNMSKHIYLNASQFYLMNKWIHLKKDVNLSNKNIIELQNLLEFLCKHPILQFSITNKFPIEYILILCSLILNDYNKAIKYADILIDKYPIKRENIINMIKEYSYQKQKGSLDNKINSKLMETYTESDVAFFHKFINKLSIEVIKEILTEKDNTEEYNNIIKKIRKTLQQLYKENIPDQMIFQQYFDF